MCRGHQVSYYNSSYQLSMTPTTDLKKKCLNNLKKKLQSAVPTEVRIGPRSVEGRDANDDTFQVMSPRPMRKMPIIKVKTHFLL